MFEVFKFKKYSKTECLTDYSYICIQIRKRMTHKITEPCSLPIMISWCFCFVLFSFEIAFLAM